MTTMRPGRSTMSGRKPERSCTHKPIVPVGPEQCRVGIRADIGGKRQGQYKHPPHRTAQWEGIGRYECAQDTDDHR